MKNVFLSFLLLILAPIVQAQTLLEADGPGNTYELINAVFAPNYDAVEEPDCNHMGFGRHIEEIFDTELGKYVFQFHIHTAEDNDRCIVFDRQRNEIKTYDKSPAELKAIKNERVQYKWKFKLDQGFQPSSSFTHLHQIKAVGGSESSMPQITLTARSGNPEHLELRYAESLSQITLKEEELSLFKGKWLEVSETILFGEINVGEYSLLITEWATGDTLFEYENDQIRMWKTDAEFQRPKWGIYRSLNNASSLRDESVLFADISIEEISGTNATSTIIEKNQSLFYPNPSNGSFTFSDWTLTNCNQFSLLNLKGETVLQGKVEHGLITIPSSSTGLYFLVLASEKYEIKPQKLLVETH